MALEGIKIPDKDSEFGVAHFRATIEIAQLMLRSLLLLNGGAILAILTFLGNAAKHPSMEEIGQSQLAESIPYFLVGVGLALLGAILAYLTMLFQRGLFKENVLRWLFSAGWTIWMIAIIGSFSGFALGSLSAISGLSR